MPAHARSAAGCRLRHGLSFSPGLAATGPVRTWEVSARALFSTAIEIYARDAAASLAFMAVCGKPGQDGGGGGGNPESAPGSAALAGLALAALAVTQRRRQAPIRP